MGEDTCGYEHTSTGNPCKRVAGWGRDVDEGLCRPHAVAAGEATSEEEDEPLAHRPTKLTKEREEGIAHMIEQGHSINASCKSNGIHRETFYRWMRNGEEQEEGLYADFHDRLTRALGEGQTMYENLLLEIARENNDAATVMSMLKQRYPDSWGEAQRGDQAAGVNVHLEAEETIEVD